jgi:hypothetical protein
VLISSDHRADIADHHLKRRGGDNLPYMETIFAFVDAASRGWSSVAYGRSDD